MSNLYRRWWPAALGVTVALCAASASAQDFGEVVMKTGVIQENLVVAGRLVSVNARVEGDVVAAGRDLLLAGLVRGDILAAGETITIQGHVEGDVRSAGRATEIGAVVTGDVMAAGDSVRVPDGASISGRAWLAGREIDVGGSIGHELKVAGREVTIRGEILGDIHIWAEQISILPSARIHGNLTYRSLSEADIHPEAQIDGDIAFLRSEAPHRFLGSAFAAAGVIGVSVFLGLLLLGAAHVLLFPNLMFTAAQTLTTSPLRALGLGLVLLLGVPFVMTLLAASIVGIPLMLILGAAYLISLATAYFVVAIAIGRRGARLVGRTAEATAWTRIAVLAAGVFALTLLGLIPVLGALVMLLALVLGLGASAIQAYRMRATARS
jgi:cytoskeletal protein CcmA (bactofilin family)